MSEKVTQLVARALVAVKKLVRVKPQISSIWKIWKNKQKHQGGENLCHTESFISLIISELLRSVVKILSFWNNFE